jgi:RNA polymerase sigma-70 factor (ECF subfamily)
MARQRRTPGESAFDEPTDPERAFRMRPEDFQAVYRELYPSLIRYVHRFTGDADASADVVQDAFLRLLEHDLPRDEARPWIFVVATNLARDGVRTRDRRRRLLAAGGEQPMPVGSPHEDLERAERIEQVRRALATLSDRDRQMLLMREEGFRYREIAGAVGVRPTSVGALVARALKRFSEAYVAPGEQNAPPE